MAKALGPSRHLLQCSAIALAVMESMEAVDDMVTNVAEVPTPGHFTADDADQLVELVKHAQRTAMTGSKGTWNDYLKASVCPAVTKVVCE